MLIYKQKRALTNKFRKLQKMDDDLAGGVVAV
jgi:hypothetical protein